MNTVAQQFAHTLKEIGVRFVFGVPSGNMIDYIEALRNEDGIDFVLTGHETTAAFMAGVTGRLTGIPGVCFGTFGPGATNLSTGVGGALLDRFPMLAFTDEMPEHLQNRKVQMNIDHQALFQPITKWTTRFKNDNVSEIILKAAGIAVSEIPGPVHVGVPAGIGLFRAEEIEIPVNYLRLEKKPFQENLIESIEKAILLLEKTKKPVFAIGLSAVRAGIQQLIVKIAEQYKAPVVITPMAKGMFPEDHPLYAGVLFHALSNLVAEIYNQADLVIGIGYDPVEFNYEQWMPPVPLIHFDSSPADVDKRYVDRVVNIVGDLNTSIEILLKTDIGKTDWDLRFILSNKTKLFKEFKTRTDIFGPISVISELRKILPEEGILTVDVGAHLHLAGQMWKTPSPEKLLMTNGWSSMGFAIPAALAAKLDNPDLPVACLCGDGGFLMMAGELATAKRLNLNIVFIVIFDNSLTLIRIKQGKKSYNKEYGTQLNNLHPEPTNHYFGVPAIRVTDEDSYKNALKNGFNSKGPLVIEAIVNGCEYDRLLLKTNR